MKLSRDTINKARKASQNLQTENANSQERSQLPFWNKPVLQERDRNRQNFRTIDMNTAGKQMGNYSVSPQIKSPKQALQKQFKKVRNNENQAQQQILPNGSPNLSGVKLGMNQKNKMHLRSKLAHSGSQGSSQNQQQSLSTPPLMKSGPGLKLPAPLQNNNRNATNSYPRCATKKLNSGYSSLNNSNGSKKSPPTLEHSVGSFQDLGFQATLGAPENNKSMFPTHEMLSHPPKTTFNMSTPAFGPQKEHLSQRLTTIVPKLPSISQSQSSQPPLAPIKHTSLSPPIVNKASKAVFHPSSVPEGANNDSGLRKLSLEECIQKLGSKSINATPQTIPEESSFSLQDAKKPQINDGGVEHFFDSNADSNVSQIEGSPEIVEKKASMRNSLKALLKDGSNDEERRQAWVLPDNSNKSSSLDVQPSNHTPDLNAIEIQKRRATRHLRRDTRDIKKSVRKPVFEYKQSSEGSGSGSGGSKRNPFEETPQFNQHAGTISSVDQTDSVDLPARSLQSQKRQKQLQMMQPGGDLVLNSDLDVQQPRMHFQDDFIDDIMCEDAEVSPDVEAESPNTFADYEISAEDISKQYRCTSTVESRYNVPTALSNPSRPTILIEDVVETGVNASKDTSLGRITTDTGCQINFLDQQQVVLPSISLDTLENNPQLPQRSLESPMPQQSVLSRLSLDSKPGDHTNPMSSTDMQYSESVVTPTITNNYMLTGANSIIHDNSSKKQSDTGSPRIPLRHSSSITHNQNKNTLRSPETNGQASFSLTTLDFQLTQKSGNSVTPYGFDPQSDSKQLKNSVIMDEYRAICKSTNQIHPTPVDGDTERQLRNNFSSNLISPDDDNKITQSDKSKREFSSVDLSGGFFGLRDEDVAIRLKKSDLRVTEKSAKSSRETPQIDTEKMPLIEIEHSEITNLIDSPSFKQQKASRNTPIRVKCHVRVKSLESMSLQDLSDGAADDGELTGRPDNESGATLFNFAQESQHQITGVKETVTQSNEMRAVAKQLQIMQSLHVSEGDDDDSDISPMALADVNKAPVAGNKFTSILSSSGSFGSKSQNVISPKNMTQVTLFEKLQTERFKQNLVNTDLQKDEKKRKKKVSVRKLDLRPALSEAQTQYQTFGQQQAPMPLIPKGHSGQVQKAKKSKVLVKLANLANQRKQKAVELAKNSFKIKLQKMDQSEGESDTISTDRRPNSEFNAFISGGQVISPQAKLNANSFFSPEINVLNQANRNSVDINSDGKFTSPITTGPNTDRQVLPKIFVSASSQEALESMNVVNQFDEFAASVSARTSKGVRTSNFLKQVAAEHSTASPDASPAISALSKSKFVPISPSKKMLESSNRQIANLPNLDRQAFMNNVPMYLGKNVFTKKPTQTDYETPRLSSAKIHSDVCVDQQRKTLSVSPNLNNQLESKESRDAIYEIFGIGCSGQKQRQMDRSASGGKKSSSATRYKTSQQITPTTADLKKTFSFAQIVHKRGSVDCDNSHSDRALFQQSDETQAETTCLQQRSTLSPVNELVTRAGSLLSTPGGTQLVGTPSTTQTPFSIATEKHLHHQDSSHKRLHQTKAKTFMLAKADIIKSASNSNSNKAVMITKIKRKSMPKQSNKNGVQLTNIISPEKLLKQ